MVVTQSWLNYGYHRELAYLHSLAAVLPFTLYLAEKPEQQRNLTDLIISLNFESLVIVSFMNENYYGVAAALFYLFSYAAVANNRSDIEGLPPKDLSNYCLCFFCYTVLRSFQSVKGICC